MNRRSVLKGFGGAAFAAAGAGTLMSACGAIRPDHPGLVLNRPSQRVQTLAAELTAGLEGDRERALALYRYVRDSIRFGFTDDFDGATPDRTLDTGCGHCNPQGALMTALFNAAGLMARLHFVAISNAVLGGLFPDGGEPPDIIDHSYTEVYLGGRWVAVDSYITDPLFYAGARARLDAEQKTLSYGMHMLGVTDWDGVTESMVQFCDPGAMTIADGGAYTDAREYYASGLYRQVFNGFGKWAFTTFAIPEVNKTIRGIRSSGQGMAA